MKDLKLKKLESFKGRSGPLVFIIMDGVGLGPENDDNAFYLAETQFLDDLQQKKHLYTELKAHGTAVGLPTDEEMGNSEVGHNAFGAGKIPIQRASLAKEAILNDKSLFQMDKWKAFTSTLVEENKSLHYIGLLSDGYVHSDFTHLLGLLDGSKNSGVKKVRVHVLLDGRDVPPQSALIYIDQLEKKLSEINASGDFDYQIASGGGRMRVTMDRYNSDWNVVRRGWEAHVCGIPEEFPSYKGLFSSASEAINQARKIEPEIIDQYLPSFVVVDENNVPVGKMEDGDGVVYFNFRGDRAIQISRAFDEEDFSEFEKKCNSNVRYYGLMLYDEKANIPNKYFIEPPIIKNPFTEYLCAEGVKQFAIAETHKFGHMTYFFNGNREGYINPDLETYVEIKSDPSETIKDNPKMKALEVKEKVLEAIVSNKYEFIRVNFANGDMVGHTGVKSAAMIAAETVDECVREISEVVEGLNGITIITADHGNLEDMSDELKTAHTCNPVMFNILDSGYSNEYVMKDNLEDPGLGNVAATILNLLGYEKPPDYLPSLIKFI